MYQILYKNYNYLMPKINKLKINLLKKYSLILNYNKLID